MANETQRTSPDPETSAEENWGDRRFSRDIIWLAREVLGPERAQATFDQYTYFTLSTKTEPNLNRRKANEEVLQELSDLVSVIEREGLTDSVKQTLLLVIEAPLNQAPIYAKIVTALLFADGLLKTSAEQYGPSLAQFNAAVEKVHLDTGFASNLLIGVLVARLQYQTGKKSLHSLLVRVTGDQALTETMANNVMAMAAVAEVYQPEIFAREISVRLPQLQLRISSQIETQDLPLFERDGYPNTLMRLDANNIPSAIKMNRAVKLGKPDRKASVLRNALPLPGLGVQVDAPVIINALELHRHFMYLEVPMLSWQPELSQTNVESFIAYDALTLYLAIRASRYGSRRIETIQQEARDPETDRFAVHALEPITRHKKIEQKKVKALLSSVQYWLDLATRPVAQKIFHLGDEEVTIPYSWLTQALEQEYGLRFILEQTQNGQLSHHEAELAKYLKVQVHKLIAWQAADVYRFDPYTDLELEKPIELSSLQIRSHSEINAQFKQYLLRELREEKVVFAVAMLADERAEDDLIEMCDRDEEFALLRALIAGFKESSAWQDEVTKLPSSLVKKLEQYFELNAEKLVMRWETIRDKFDPSIINEEDEVED